MPDRFGDEITAPRCAGLHRRQENAAFGFAEFWHAWPRGPRKVAKQQCLNKWAKYECADNAAHIIAHVEQMKRSPDWTKEGGAFIPAPLVYLNQRRWDGEPLEALDTTSRAAVEAQGVRMGLGKWNELEQWAIYRDRVLLVCNKERS